MTDTNMTDSTKITVTLDVDVSSVEKARIAAESMKDSFTQMTNLNNVVNESLQTTVDLADNVSESMSKNRGDRIFRDNEEAARKLAKMGYTLIDGNRAVNSGMLDLVTYERLLRGVDGKERQKISGYSFQNSVLADKSTRNELTREMKTDIDRIVPDLIGLIKERFSSTKGENAPYHRGDHSLNSFAQSLMKDSRAKELMEKRLTEGTMQYLNHHPSIQKEIFTTILAAAVPAANTGNFTTMRYGYAFSAKSMFDRERPEDIIPKSFQNAFANKGYTPSERYTANQNAGQTASNYLSKNQRNVLMTALMNDPYAATIANRTGIAYRTKQGELVLNSAITEETYENFRRGMYQLLERRLQSYGSHRINDIYADDSEIKGKLSSRMSSAYGAGQTLATLQRLEDIENHNFTNRKGGTFSRNQSKIREQKRGLDLYTVRHYAPFTNGNDRYTEETITESNATRALGLQKRGYYGDASDSVAVINLKGYDETNPEHVQRRRDILENGWTVKGVNGKDVHMIVQSMKRDDDGNVMLRLVSDDGVSQVNEAMNAKLKKAGLAGFKGSFFDLFADQTGIQNIGERKYFDAANKIWSSSSDTGIDLSKTKLFVGDFKKLFDGMGFLPENILPNAIQARGAGALKGTLRSFPGSLRDYAIRMGLATKNEQTGEYNWFVKALNGEMVDIIDKVSGFDGFIDLSMLKNFGVYMDEAGKFFDANTVSAMLQKAFLLDPLSQMKDYSQYDSTSQSLGVQASSYMRFDASYMKKQREAFIERLRALNTAEGRLKYVFANPEADALSRLVHSPEGRQDLFSDAANKRVNDYIFSLQSMMMKGELVDFSNDENNFRNVELHDLLSTGFWRGEDGKPNVPQQVLNIARQALLKNGYDEKLLTDKYLTDILTLADLEVGQDNKVVRGYGAYFANPDLAEIGLQRSPSSVNSFVTIENVAKELGIIYKELGEVDIPGVGKLDMSKFITQSGIMVSDKVRETLSTADFDGDIVKLITNQEHLKMYKDSIARMPKKPFNAAKAAVWQIIKEASTNPTKSKEEYIDDLEKEGLQMGQASAIIMGALQHDVSDEQNKNYIEALYAGVDYYDQLSTFAKKPVKFDFKKFGKLMSEGKEFTKLASNLPKIFSLDDDMQLGNGNADTNNEDVFVASNGQAINLRKLRELSLRKTNGASVFMDNHVMAIAALGDARKRGLYNPAQLTALSEALAHIGNNDPLSEALPAANQLAILLDQMIVQQGMGARIAPTKEEAEMLAALRAQADKEIGNYELAHGLTDKDLDLRNRFGLFRYDNFFGEGGFGFTEENLQYLEPEMRALLQDMNTTELTLVDSFDMSNASKVQEAIEKGKEAEAIKASREAENAELNRRKAEVHAKTPRGKQEAAHGPVDPNMPDVERAKELIRRINQDGNKAFTINPNDTITIGKQRNPKKLTAHRFTSAIGASRFSSPFQAFTLANTKMKPKDLKYDASVQAGNLYEEDIIKHIQRLNGIYDQANGTEGAVNFNDYYTGLGKNKAWFKRGDAYQDREDELGKVFGGKWDAAQIDANGNISRIYEVKTASEKQKDEWINTGIPFEYLLQAALYANLEGIEDFSVVGAFMNAKDTVHEKAPGVFEKVAGSFMPNAENTHFFDFKLEDGKININDTKVAVPEQFSKYVHDGILDFGQIIEYAKQIYKEQYQEGVSPQIDWNNQDDVTALLEGYLKDGAFEKLLPPTTQEEKESIEEEAAIDKKMAKNNEIIAESQRDADKAAAIAAIKSKKDEKNLLYQTIFAGIRERASNNYFKQKKAEDQLSGLSAGDVLSKFTLGRAESDMHMLETMSSDPIIDGELKKEIDKYLATVMSNAGKLYLDTGMLNVQKTIDGVVDMRKNKDKKYDQTGAAIDGLLKTYNDAESYFSQENIDKALSELSEKEAKEFKENIDKKKEELAKSKKEDLPDLLQALVREDNKKVEKYTSTSTKMTRAQNKTFGMYDAAYQYEDTLDAFRQQIEYGQTMLDVKNATLENMSKNGLEDTEAFKMLKNQVDALTESLNACKSAMEQLDTAEKRIEAAAESSKQFVDQLKDRSEQLNGTLDPNKKELAPIGDKIGAINKMIEEARAAKEKAEQAGDTNEAAIQEEIISKLTQNKVAAKGYLGEISGRLYGAQYDAANGTIETINNMGYQDDRARTKNTYLDGLRQKEERYQQYVAAQEKANIELENLRKQRDGLDEDSAFKAMSYKDQAKRRIELDHQINKMEKQQPETAMLMQKLLNDYGIGTTEGMNTTMQSFSDRLEKAKGTYSTRAKQREKDLEEVRKMQDAADTQRTAYKNALRASDYYHQETSELLPHLNEEQKNKRYEEQRRLDRQAKAEKLAAEAAEQKAKEAEKLQQEMQAAEDDRYLNDNELNIERQMLQLQSTEHSQKLFTLRTRGYQHRRQNEQYKLSLQEKRNGFVQQQTEYDEIMQRYADNPEDERYIKAKQGKENATAAISQIDNLTKKAGGNIKATLKGGLSDIGEMAGRALSRMFTQALRSALNEVKRFVKEYDAAMTEIQMVTLKSDDQIDELGEGLLKKAIEMKQSFSKISSIAIDLYRQGLDDADVEDRLEQIAKFTTTANVKAADATKLVTVALSSGMVDSAEQAMDVVTALGDSAATNAEQITKGLQKSMSAAKETGVTYKQLVSMLTVITSKTQLSGNIAGTTLSTMFSRLSKIGTDELLYDDNGNAVSGSAVANLLRSVGVETYVDGKQRSSYDIFTDLGMVWEDLRDAKQNQILTALTGGGRQFSNGAALMQGFTEVDENGQSVTQKMMEIAEGSDGLTDEKYEKYMKSYAAAVTDVTNSIDALAASINTSDVFIGFLNFFSEALTGVKEFNEALGGLPIILGAVGLAITAIAANMEKHPVILAVTGVIAGVTALAGVIRSLSKPIEVKSAKERMQEVESSFTHEEGLLRKAKEINERRDENGALSTGDEIELRKTFTQLNAMGDIANDAGKSIKDLATSADNAAKTISETENIISEKKTQEKAMAAAEAIEDSKQQYASEAEQYNNRNYLYRDTHGNEKRIEQNAIKVAQFYELKDLYMSGENAIYAGMSEEEAIKTAANTVFGREATPQRSTLAILQYASNDFWFVVRLLMEANKFDAIQKEDGNWFKKGSFPGYYDNFGVAKGIMKFDSVIVKTIYDKFLSPLSEGIPFMPDMDDFSLFASDNIRSFLSNFENELGKDLTDVLFGMIVEDMHNLTADEESFENFSPFNYLLENFADDLGFFQIDKMLNYVKSKDQDTYNTLRPAENPITTREDKATNILYNSVIGLNDVDNLGIADEMLQNAKFQKHNDNMQNRLKSIFSLEFMNRLSTQDYLENQNNKDLSDMIYSFMEKDLNTGEVEFRKDITEADYDAFMQLLYSKTNKYKSMAGYRSSTEMRKSAEDSFSIVLGDKNGFNATSRQERFDNLAMTQEGTEIAQNDLIAILGQEAVDRLINNQMSDAEIEESKRLISMYGISDNNQEKSFAYYDEAARELFGADYRYQNVNIDESLLSNYASLKETDKGSSLLSRISEMEGGAELLKELDIMLNDTERSGKDATEAFKEFNKQMGSKANAETYKWLKNGEQICNMLDEIAEDGKEAAGAIMNLQSKTLDLGDVDAALRKYENKTATDSDIGILTSHFSGISKEDLKNSPKEVMENYAKLMRAAFEEERTEVESELKAVLKEEWTNILAQLPEHNLTIDDITVDGKVNYASLRDAIENFGIAVSDEFMAQVNACEALSVTLSVTGDDNGTISVDASNINTGGHGRPSGGGGGSRRSEAEKLIAKQNHGKDLFEHQVQMAQYEQTRYQNAGELSNYIQMLEEEKRIEQDYLPVLENNIATMRAQLATTSQGSDDWYTLRDAILAAEEQYASINNTIDEVNGKIEETQQAILKLHTDLEDMVVEQIKAQLEAEKNRLDGTVAMQDTILNAIKDRYTKEWELIKKDIEKKKEALEEEKNLIDERLNARKNAENEAEKYEELAELKRQLSLISMDSTRTRDAAELRERIAELENEIGWDIAEQQAENEQSNIQDQIDAYDDYMTQGDEELNTLLADANNFAEEVNSVLQMNHDDLFSWLAENVEEYSNSLDEAQAQMIESWEDTYDQMLGITETYWSQVNAILSSKQAFIDYMKQSEEYQNASEDQRLQLVYQWETAYDNWQNAQTISAIQSHPDPNMGDTSGNLPNGSSGSDGGRWKYIISYDGNANYYEKRGYSSREEAQTAGDNYIKSHHLRGARYRTARYEKGGLSTQTGLAWLDGTLQKPERVLSAEQTKSFDNLIGILDDFRNAGFEDFMMRDMLKWSSTVSVPASLSCVGKEAFSSSMATIGDVYVTVNEAEIGDEYDIDELADNVGRKFAKELSKQGFNIANFQF